ncbi:MAG: signal peptidase I [Clostridiales bacterium]|nr:signal peptidase I [Clostridiales bacterium]
MKKHDKSEYVEVKPGDRKNEIIASILDWLIAIAIGVLAGILLVVFVVQRDNVYGDSMVPNLRDGYIVMTDKVSTYFDNYHRGDIVILDGEDMEGYNHDEYLIKRIVGMPGETIRIADGHVYIREVGAADFYMLDEPYLADGVETYVMSWGFERGYNEVTLGPDEYYCMGDNRPVSNDSRNLGPFSSDRIKGIAFVIIYPFNAFSLI